jgi:hypothetical protein
MDKFDDVVLDNVQKTPVSVVVSVGTESAEKAEFVRRYTDETLLKESAREVAETSAVIHLDSVGRVKRMLDVALS